MWRINGECSNFSSKKANSFLNTYEDANKPMMVINTNNDTNEMIVSKKGLPVKPTKENTPSKKLNN